MPQTILVVDDSLFSRKAAKKALLPLGCELLEATNGQEALDFVAASEPDLVVTDLLMPVLDGVQFLAQLRGQGSMVPVIVASADIQESTRSQCEALGINGFLNKPYKAEDLQVLAGAALGQPQESLS